MIRLPPLQALRAPVASSSTSIARHTPRVLRQLSTAASAPAPPPQITTLPNNLRVVTEDTPGHFQAVGVYVDAGSRYETPRNSGVSHLVDRMAFKSTDRFSDEEMTTLIDSLGGQMVCQSGRDTLMFQSLIWPHHLPLALSLISSTMIHPLLLPAELESAKAAAAYEIREIWNKPEVILPEIVHSTAFQGNTVGNPLLCPEEQLAVVGEREIRGYMRDWYRPERMVVSGVGMPHGELVELAIKEFGSLPASSSSVGAARPTPTPTSGKGYAMDGGRERQAGQPAGSKSYATVSNVPIDEGGAVGSSVEERERLAGAKAVYTGGERYIEKDEEFVHLYIGFEGVGLHDPDIYALACLATLLGGGGSFSAGGPGKGMYSRLYTHALNRYHAIDHCQSFHHCYADTGLFGIGATVYPQFASRIASVIAGQLHALTGSMRGGIDPQEFGRAKNMLKSSLVMGLESRLVAAEDLGRQTLTHGKKVPVEEMCAKIDALRIHDLHRVATRVLRPSAHTTPLNFGLGSGKPTIVAQGPALGVLGDVRAELRRWGLGAQ